MLTKNLLGSMKFFCEIYQSEISVAVFNAINLGQGHWFKYRCIIYFSYILILSMRPFSTHAN